MMPPMDTVKMKSVRDTHLMDEYDDIRQADTGMIDRDADEIKKKKENAGFVADENFFNMDYEGRAFVFKERNMLDKYPNPLNLNFSDSNPIYKSLLSKNPFEVNFNQDGTFFSNLVRYPKD